MYNVYSRVDPCCMTCARSKLDTSQGILGLVTPEDLFGVSGIVLPLILSAFVLSPLVLMVSPCPSPSRLTVGLQGP